MEETGTFTSGEVGNAFANDLPSTVLSEINKALEKWNKQLEENKSNDIESILEQIISIVSNYIKDVIGESSCDILQVIGRQLKADVTSYVIKGEVQDPDALKQVLTEEVPKLLIARFADYSNAKVSTKTAGSKSNTSLGGVLASQTKCLSNATFSRLLSMLKNEIKKLEWLTKDAPEVASKQIAAILEKYITPDTLRDIQPYICDILKNVNMHIFQVPKNTGSKAVGHISQKTDKVIDSLSSDFHKTVSNASIEEFVEGLYDLLASIFSDLKESAKQELTALLKKLQNDFAKKSVTSLRDDLIPKLSKTIQQSIGYSPEKQLKVLIPPITVVIQKFLQTGEIPTKQCMEQTAKDCVNALIFEEISTCISALQLKFESEIKKLEWLTKDAPEVASKHIAAILEKYIKPDTMRDIQPYMCDIFKDMQSSVFQVLKNTGSIAAGHISNKKDKVIDSLSSDFCKTLSNTSIEEFVEGLYDLLASIFSDLKESAKQEFTALLKKLRDGFAKKSVTSLQDAFIPKLSKIIQQSIGYSPEKQLKVLEPPITVAIQKFLQTGQIPTKEEIKQTGKDCGIALIVETLIPNMSQEVKERTKNVINHIWTTVINTGFSKKSAINIFCFCVAEAIGASEEAKTRFIQLMEQMADIVPNLTATNLSMENFFQTLKVNMTSGKLNAKLFKSKIDGWIERMPDAVDTVMEFVCRNVLPLLPLYTSTGPLGIIIPFVKVAIEEISETGTIRGRVFIKPAAVAVIVLAGNAAKAKAAGTATAGNALAAPLNIAAKEVVTEVKKEMVEKFAVKFITNEAGEIVGKETTKKLSVTLSRHAVTKCAKKGGEKVIGETIQTSSKKVAEKVVQQSGEAAKRSISMASKKTFQRAGEQAVKKGEGFINKASETVIKFGKSRKIEGTKKVTDKFTKFTVKKTTESSVKVNEKFVEKAAIEGAKVGLKEVAKAAMISSGISALMGCPFLCLDLKDLKRKLQAGEITQLEYNRLVSGRYGQYGGEIAGSAISAAVATAAALSGPAGWAMFAGGVAFSYAAGYFGKVVAEKINDS
eukprot:gene5943-6633_t